MNFSASLHARLWRISQLLVVNRHRQTLSEIVSRQQASVDRIIVFPPGLDWNRQLFQRPQHLALALAKQGMLVFYVEPEESDGPAGFRQEAENLYLCHVPLAAFEDLTSLWVHTFTWNQKYTRQFSQPRLIYDFVDDLSAFEGDHIHLEEQHAALLRDARLVLATAERLRAQVIDQRPDVILCPNGVDYTHFVSVECPAPPEMAPILARGRPVIGYYGALAAWFDFNLLEVLAKKRSDLSFVLIGPDHDGSLPPGLLELGNIFWLGVKPYAKLPRYLCYFDVAIIPFKLNEITHATSPLKLFEYMAAGKPVVVTPMQESMRYEGVLVADGADEFSAKLDQALRLRRDPAYLALLDRVARENTWDARARQILAAITVLSV